MRSLLKLFLGLTILVPLTVVAAEDPALELPVPAKPIRGGGVREDATALRQGSIYVIIGERFGSTRVSQSLVLPRAAR